MLLTYVGPDRVGVSIGDDGPWCPYGEPTEVPDDLADKVLAEQPDNFEAAKPAKSTRKHDAAGITATEES
jgi:hypothetical protein